MARPTIISENDLTDIKEQSKFGLINKNYIVDTYGVSARTADRVILRCGLVHARQYLIDLAGKYFEGFSVKQLSNEYNISQVTINAFFRRHRIESFGTQYRANFRYFKEIDCEEKAYFLGFIFADGCIHRNSLIIGLSSVDKEILIKFKKIMNSNHKIADGQTVCSLNNAVTYYSRLVITHKYLIKDLIKCGVDYRKTETMIFPKISDDLIRHFIRGYFDGDGSFSVYNSFNKKKNISEVKYTFSLEGTPPFLESVRSYIDKSLDLSINSKLRYRNKGSNSCVCSLRTSGKARTLKFLNWIYSDSSIYLDRKYNKWLHYKE